MEREKQSLVNKINLLNKEIKLQRTDIKTLKFHLEKSESARYLDKTTVSRHVKMLRKLKTSTMK